MSYYYCEICGREITGSQAKKAVVEDVPMILCPQCFTRLSAQGKARLQEENKKPKQQTQVPKPQIPRRPPTSTREEYEVREDYAKIIKEARERLGWSQQVLANKVRESENTIKRIEAGKLKPSLELARRLEKVLGVKLLEPVVEEKVNYTGTDEEGLTLGDFIELNK